MKRIAFCLCLFSCCATSLSAAEHPLFDRLPRQVRGSLSIRDLDGLRTRGNQLLKDLERDNTFELGQIFQMGLDFLGIRGGVDRNGTFSIILADWGTREFNEQEDWNYLVLRIPYDEADAMAGNFTLPAGSLDDKTIHKVPNRLMPDREAFLGSDRSAVYYGFRSDAVRSVLDSEKLSKANIEDAEGRVAECDVLLHLHLAPFIAEGKEVFLNNLLNPFWGSEGPTDAALRERVRDIVLHSEELLISFRIDAGLHMRAQLTLGEGISPESKALLTGWGRGDREPTLRHLPEGLLLAGISRAANRAEDSEVSRLLMQWMTRQPWMKSDVQHALFQLLEPSRETFLGAFDEVYRTLRESRVGLYLNQNTEELGLVTAVAILEPSSGEEFQTTLADILKYSRGTNYDPATKRESAITADEIRKLVAQLGANEFDTRKAATLRLKLLGDPAVPLLEEAANSNDPEVKARAGRLLTEIRRSLAERQQLLVKRGIPDLPRPTFVLYPKHTQIEGFDVDLIEARWESIDERQTAAMQQMLGPHGHEILLARAGTRFVVCVGSDRALLAQALKSIQADDAGLERRVELFRKHDARGRNAETHFSLQHLRAIVPDAFPNYRNQNRDWPAPTPTISSVNIEISPQILRADFSLPLDELRVAAYLFWF